MRVQNQWKSSNPKQVGTLNKLISKLHQVVECLFQPSMSCDKGNEAVTFMKEPLGRNLLCEMLFRISLSVGLSRRYTNRCLHATSMFILKEGEVDNCSVYSVTKHKGFQGFDSYNKLCEEECQKIAASLGEAVLGSTTILPTAAQDA